MPLFTLSFRKTISKTKSITPKVIPVMEEPIEVSQNKKEDIKPKLKNKIKVKNNSKVKLKNLTKKIKEIHIEENEDTDD
jgi:hypothetical protein